MITWFLTVWLSNIKFGIFCFVYKKGHNNPPLAPYSESPGPSANRASEVSGGCSRSLPLSNQMCGHTNKQTCIYTYNTNIQGCPATVWDLWHCPIGKRASPPFLGLRELEQLLPASCQDQQYAIYTHAITHTQTHNIRTQTHTRAHDRMHVVK